MNYFFMGLLVVAVIADMYFFSKRYEENEEDR
jgi:hypothetical protein